MNLHSYESGLKNFFTDFIKPNKKKQYLSGCYIVSRDQYPHDFKLGMSTDLMSRIINQYKICMSHKNECFIHYAVICPRESIKNKSYSKIVEKLLAVIAEDDTESYSHEWFLSGNDMDTVGNNLVEVIKQNPKLVMTVIKFESDGFYILNTGSSNYLKQNEWSVKTNFDKTPNFDPAVNLFLVGESNETLLEVARAEQQRLIEQAELLKNNTVLAEEARRISEEREIKSIARRLKYADNKVKRDIEKLEQKKKELLLKKPIVSNITKRSKRVITVPARFRD